MAKMEKFGLARYLLPCIVSASVGGCGLHNGELLTAAEAFHDEAEQCMQEVRDTEIIYTESDHCIALFTLSNRYFDVLDDPHAAPSDIELLYERGRLYAWMAIATSNARGAKLDRLWPHTLSAKQ